MKNKSLEGQIKMLKVDIELYAKKARDRKKRAEPILKEFRPSQIKPMMKLMKAQKDMGITDGDLVNLAHRNLLPEKLQLLFDEVARPLIRSQKNEAHLEDTSSFSFSKKSRYNFNTWQCSCGSTQTVWFRTHLEIKDRYEIYCKSCSELAGWGSEKDLKSAQAAKCAELLMIKSFFERYEYHPPLLLASVNKTPDKRVRAKRSQSK